MGYQPPLSHPVFYNGAAINTQNWQTGTEGVAITRVEGWFEAPEVRDVRNQNPGRDGELADNLFLGGRTITLEGMVSGNTYADLQAKKQALSAKLIPGTSEYVLKMPKPDNASPSWTHSSSMADFERVSARVVEGVQFGDNDGPLLQSWAVTLRASDPLVYSDTLTTVDSGTTGTAARTAAVSNTGTVASPGTLVVTGPTASAWSVSDSDSNTLLQFSGLALANTGSTTEIDLQARTITTRQPYKESRLGLSTVKSLWMLNESAGTTADNAEGTAARDGTYTGGYTLNQAGPATGIASVSLNGTTGYISVPYSAALYGGNYYKQFWEFWVNPDAISGTQTITDSMSSSKGFTLEILSTGNLQYSVGVILGAVLTVDSGVKIPAASWSHIVIHFQQNFVQMYLNGVLVHTKTNFESMVAPTATGLRFGSTLAGANFFKGKLGPILNAYTTSSTTWVTESDLVNNSTTNSGQTSSFNKLDFSTALWSSINTGSTTYTLDSTGLNTGSKLSVQYRSARI